MKEQNDPSRGIDELREFIDGLPISKETRDDLTGHVFTQMSVVMDLAYAHGFHDAMNVGHPEFRDALEQVTNEMGDAIRQIGTPSAN